MPDTQAPSSASAFWLCKHCPAQVRSKLEGPNVGTLLSASSILHWLKNEKQITTHISALWGRKKPEINLFHLQKSKIRLLVLNNHHRYEMQRQRLSTVMSTGSCVQSLTPVAHKMEPQLLIKKHCQDHSKKSGQVLSDFSKSMSVFDKKNNNWIKLFATILKRAEKEIDL